MKAASLLGVFLLAKACVLAGRDMPLSVWTPLAYLWQDLLVVAVFALVEQVVRSRPVVWGLYALVAVYAAINVPVARVLATPLTVPLLRAARGPLMDSIAYYVTWANVGLLALVLTAAAAFPFLLPRCVPRLANQPRQPRWRIAILASTAIPILILGGPVARNRTDTVGLERNCLVALVASAFPHDPQDSTTFDATTDWRASPFPGEAGEDLTKYRGAASGRNVVVVHLESTAARYLRSYGANEDPMPNLTRLAEQAILFENAYAVYPESIKGLFSVLCSTYPALDTQPEDYEKITTPALPAVLAAAGYRTALFHSGRFSYLGMESIIRNRGYQTMEDAGAIGGEHDSSFGVDEPSTVRRMLAWIDSVPKGERFLVTYLPIAGHHPYFVPEPGPFPDADDINRYRNALHYADAALGQLLQGLRDRGLDQNTLFVIFGDHGEAFGQHPGNFGHTVFIFEENVHVPFLIAAPRLVSEPVRVRRVASLIDTAPTILDLLGIESPGAYQGRSLLDADPRTALFFTDYSLAFLGARDGDWKLIHEIDSGRSKLFNLREDPEERRDCSALLPDRTAAYRDHLLGWAAAQRRLLKR